MAIVVFLYLFEAANCFDRASSVWPALCNGHLGLLTEGQAPLTDPLSLRSFTLPETPRIWRWFLDLATPRIWRGFLDLVSAILTISVAVIECFVFIEFISPLMILNSFCSSYGN